MGIFLLWATWAHEYMAIFVKLMGIARRVVLKDWRYVILIKFGQHVKTFPNFYWSHFLIIRQNINMATYAILNSGLTL